MHSSNREKLFKNGTSRFRIIRKTLVAKATAKISIAKAIIRIAFILATDINIEVVKIKASFLVSRAADIWRHNAFSNYNLANHLAWVFFGLIYIAISTIAIISIDGIDSKS